MPAVATEESVLTATTIVGAIIGVIIGFLVLPYLWAPLLGLLTGFEWLAALIAFGIFILGYKLVKYTEDAPDVIGAILTMLGLTLLVFAVWYWLPEIALNIMLFPPVITIGLIVGGAAFIVGLLLIYKYKTRKMHLNDIGEFVGLIYGGFMLYVWLTEIFLIPLLKGLGIDVQAIIDPWYWLKKLF